MLNTSAEIYKVVDPSQRDAKWMDECISSVRRYWRPIINQVANAVNKDYLFSKQSMETTISMFKAKGDFLKQRAILPLPLLENIKNALVEEITRNPPKMELKANDAAALTDKQFDMILLRLKAQQEAIVNQINKKVGDPPEVIGNDKFKTNIDEFYRMNLDPNDPEDVNFYEQNNFPKLKYEIAGQKLIDIILKLNRFDEDKVEDFVIDILADKVICMDIYVDQITGEIKYEYIYPDTFYGIFGKKSDGTDDIAKGYENSINVNKFLEKVGNEFDWDRDWTKLLWAINFRNGFTYTGFRRNNIEYDVRNMAIGTQMGVQNSAPNYLEWNMAYTYEVYLGKIEFKVPNITATYLKKRSTGEVVSEVNYDYQLNGMEETKEYQTESWYQQQTYTSWYIATSGISQWVFNWGCCPYQRLYGANDEYSAGTLWYYRKRGKSAVELAIPYITLCNDAFYKMVWAVYEAHPDWEVYQVEELTELARVMYSKVGEIGQNTAKNPAQIKTQLTEVIKYFRNNLVKLKTIPRVDGKPMPQMNNLPVTEKRGLDPIAIAMQTVCDYAENQLARKLGFNDIRWDGNVDNARKGLGQGKMEMDQSLTNTGYIFRMIEYLKQLVCTSTLTISQDIVRFKDTLPYKWVGNLVGVEDFENLKLLEDFAAHRYALIFENYSAVLERQTFIQLVRQSMDTGDGRGGIGIIEAGILLSTEDYKQGLRKLAYFKYKADKLKRRQELELLKIQQENAMALKAEDQKLEAMKINGKLQDTSMITKTQLAVAQIAAKNKVDVKNIQGLQEPIKQDLKVQGDSKLIQEQADADAQKALV